MPELISRGAVGILPPSTDSVLLKKAIKAVSEGELWIERKTLKDMLTSPNLSEKMVDLTRKEE
jgi:DNA-binding NarL/FixJ family response regulator